MIHPEAKIHTHSLIDENVEIGAGTRVWAFAHILSGAKIGDDCNICDHTFLEGNVIVGNRVTVKCGVYLWDGVIIEDDVFIGPAAVFTNDLKPRSQRFPEGFTKTILKAGCSIGANSTIVAGNIIGAWSLVGAASVVTKDVPDFAVVWGNPATFRYWICCCTKQLVFGNSNIFECDCGKTYNLDTENNRVKICL